MNLTSLLKSLKHLTETRRTGALLSPSGQYLSVGFEALPPGTAYSWDGAQRRVDSANPFVVFQYTLAGWGVYEENGLVQRIMPGDAFAACIPSTHVYSLPTDSPGWTYFWIMFNHPYALERISHIKTTVGSITTLDVESVTLARLVRLFEGVCQGGFRDEWAQEAAIFEFLWEYERHEHSRRYAFSQRDQLLTEVRSEVMATLNRPPDVPQLARSREMSRSHFGHHFKAATGLSPAQFVTQVRLEEVVRRLMETDEILPVIAEDTGFADANHLCKVFRRHYRLSPGAFRRQMR